MTSAKAGDRSARTFWFDPRFAIGLGLVVASVVGVGAVVTSAQDSTTVYTATKPLVAGEVLTTDDLKPTRVRLSTAEDLYLSDLPRDAVMVRTVEKGELVPASAVGDAGDRTTTSVVVPVTGRLAASIGPGRVVDVWSAAKTEHEGFAPPTVLAASATVVHVVTDDSLMAGGAGTAVEVRVPGDDVASLLAAIANGDAVSVVPHSVGATRSGQN